jgi:hypothetical protein
VPKIGVVEIHVFVYIGQAQGFAASRGWRWSRQGAAKNMTEGGEEVGEKSTASANY